MKKLTTNFGTRCPLTGTFTSESMDPEVARILRNKKLDFVPHKKPEKKIEERPLLTLVRFNPHVCTPQANKNLIASHEVTRVGHTKKHRGRKQSHQYGRRDAFV